MLEFTSRPKDAPEAERVPFFSVDGVQYTHPKEVDATLALRALDITATQGEMVANRWLMIQVIGEEGYRALLNCRGLGKSDLAKVQEVIRALVFGDTEEEGKG
jgi:hypothetical protein